MPYSTSLSSQDKKHSPDSASDGWDLEIVELDKIDQLFWPSFNKLKRASTMLMITSETSTQLGDTSVGTTISRPHLVLTTGSVKAGICSPVYERERRGGGRWIKP
ncbi:hypothetical protein TSAR_003540, partial [Trichomalopsis sarcophagae]